MIPRHHDPPPDTHPAQPHSHSLVGPLLALPITDQFSLSGLVNNVSTFRLSDLQAYTPVTQTVAFQSKSSTVSSSFIGVQRYDLLASAQGGGGIV